MALQNKKQIPWGALALTGLMSLCLLWRFPDFFTSPNSKVIEAWGDGYKTYLAFIYHIRYDSTYKHFQGMNYPYGEHVIPGDTQPGLSNAVKATAGIFPGIENYAIGILHFSLLFSLLLSALFLYLIFKRLDAPWWFSAVAAIGVTFLAPPTERMIAHYGLAHPAALAGAYYFLLLWEERPRWRYSLLLALWVWFFSLIHFYFFAVLSLTIGGYLFFSWLHKRRASLLPRYVLHFSVQLLLPLAFFWWWMIAGDPVHDRTASPWGFLHYCATIDGVFASQAEPHFQWISKAIKPFRHVDFEARSYIGLVAVFGLLILIGRVFWHRFRQAPVPASGRRAIYLNAVFYTGIAILLFSLALPFSIKGLGHLLEYAGPLRQFRAMGRFAWSFYFSINIVAIVSLASWAAKGPKLRWYLSASALLVLLYEAYFFTKSFDVRLDPIEEFEKDKRFTNLQIGYDNFQAILPVPYYNIGSDNFWWQLSGFIGQKTQTLGAQTGLPTTGAMLTRTSISQTINQLQLITEPYRRPLIFRDFPNRKPLLLAWDEERVAQGAFNYAHLLEGAQLIYENPPLRFYRLPLQVFDERITQRTYHIEKALTDSTLVRRDGWVLAGNTAKPFIYESFDEQISDRPYIGKGGFLGVMADENVVFEGSVPDTGRYMLQVWMFVNADLYARTTVLVQELDPDTGAERQRAEIQVKDLTTVFDDKGWALLEIPFAIQQKNSRLKWIFQHKELHRHPLWLDEMLIRPEGLDIFADKKDFVFKNNRWMER